jgi:hypothetical protein
VKLKAGRDFVEIAASNEYEAGWLRWVTRADETPVALDLELRDQPDGAALKLSRRKKSKPGVMTHGK